jgi:L-alanine-DL-glutamate epimerase-like enolase superfamily enzyme
LKITHIEAIPFYIPFDPELSMKLAYRVSTAAEHVLVRIHTDEGIEGIAEAPARPQIYGETQKSIVAAIEGHLAAAIIGKDPFDLEKIHPAMDNLVGNLTAKGAIDIALHDIMGKKVNLPVHKLLGSWSGQKVSLSWMVGLKKADEMARECEKYASMGFKAFKVKAGLNPAEDVENLKAIRKAVGKEATLYIDGNQGYTPQGAKWAIQRMEEYGLAWVEEPCPVWNRKGRLDLARSISVPILGDESCFAPQDVVRELELGAIGMVLIKVARSGFFKSRKIVHLCEQAGIPCLIGSQGDSSIGAAAGAHLATSFRNIQYPAEISYHLRMTGDLLQNSVKIFQGFIEIPEAPGLGIRVDEGQVKKYRL